MFFRIFSEIPQIFHDKHDQFRFESILATCFRIYPHPPKIDRKEYPTKLREALFLSFRKRIKNDVSVKEALDNAMQIVDLKIDQYIIIAEDHPELFEFSLDRMLEIVEKMDQ
jgi:hypothetical protein